MISGHEPVAPLRPLIRVGVGAERDRLVLPRRRGQLAAEHLGHVDLHDDLLVEIAPGIEVEVGVGAPREAVRAGVAAPAVGIDGPVERHRGCRGHMIQRRLRRHLVEGHARELRGRDRAHQTVEALHAGQGSGIRRIDTLSTPPHTVHSNRDTTNVQCAGAARARRAEWAGAAPRAADQSPRRTRRRCDPARPRSVDVGSVDVEGAAADAVDGIRDRLLCCGGDLRRLGVLPQRRPRSERRRFRGHIERSGGRGRAARRSGCDGGTRHGAAGSRSDRRGGTVRRSRRGHRARRRQGRRRRRRLRWRRGLPRRCRQRRRTLRRSRRPAPALDRRRQEAVPSTRWMSSPPSWSPPPTCSARSTVGCSRRLPRR